MKYKCKEARFFQASTNKLFGESNPEQNELAPFEPRSPYAIAEQYGYRKVKNYREGYYLITSNGIVFTHEFPRQGETFVTRKITRALVRIIAGKQKVLFLGNLDSLRDWGYAPDYVRAMWLMLQQYAPEYFVLATGKLHSVREICEVAFTNLGLNYKDYVRIDQQFFRPETNTPLVGNPEKANCLLGWSAQKEFKEIIIGMASCKLDGSLFHN